MTDPILRRDAGRTIRAAARATPPSFALKLGDMVMPVGAEVTTEDRETVVRLTIGPTIVFRTPRGQTVRSVTLLGAGKPICTWPCPETRLQPLDTFRVDFDRGELLRKDLAA